MTGSSLPFSGWKACVHRKGQLGRVAGEMRHLLQICTVILTHVKVAKLGLCVKVHFDHGCEGVKNVLLLEWGCANL